MRRAHGAPSKNSGAARPVRAPSRSPKEGTARTSAGGVASRRPSAHKSPPQTTSGGQRTSLERRTATDAPVEKSSEATRQKFPLSLRRDRGPASQGLQSARVSPEKSSAAMPARPSSGSPVASRPAAAASPQSGEASSSRGVTLPPLDIPSPLPITAAGAPRVTSNIRVTVPPALLQQYVPTTSLPAIVTTTTVTTTTCGSPIMATGIPLGGRRSPSPPMPARRRSPPVVQQQQTVWSPEPCNDGFSLVMGEGASGQTRKRKTPPHEHPGVEQQQRQQQQQQQRRSTPPARDCGEPEVLSGETVTACENKAKQNITEKQIGKC
ncbi:serine/arginine repetitive matrix protein 1-like [Pseudomyrmex gracilis]|uniref:serine/arginine repetitive matrix protein 1-like n=1 Tax=Pseudomyrmex gracilis TaxID=219809 RepID=UPI000995B96F|nr:serine/arginine repetitive matrix protein 1-like [Pseudomyrmex gracilis]